jgi:glycosyltransferase involved in cell wall biosynthesis
MESKLPSNIRRHEVGAVLIGRNEGDRLRQCLDSIPEDLGAVVYVDSGSSDGSLELARGRGITVVELDLETPFTAARARNAGFARACEDHRELRAVQFIDGDCSLVPGWLEAAMAHLDSDPNCAAVCGWRRERFPEASVYNRLCDLEWIAPPLGDVGEFGFGGDVLIRVAAFRALGGYSADLIAGEDPELSSRLRMAGYSVRRIDQDMTRHDADIHSLGAWWMRSKRGGHAVAEVAWRHREQRLFARHLRSIWIWGALLPATLFLALVFGGVRAWPVLLSGAALYALQLGRIAKSQDEVRYSPADALLWGASCLVSQPPKALGALQFAWSRLLGRRKSLIEYK